MDDFDPTSSAKSIQQHLVNPNFTSILRKAHFLRRLNQFWQTLLPVHLQERSQVANFDKGILSIAVESAEWAVELRYQRAALQQQLKATPFGQELKKLHIFISPPLSHPPIADRPKPILSPASAQLINATAVGITDIKLKKALLRLAKACPALAIKPTKL